MATLIWSLFFYVPEGALIVVVPVAILAGLNGSTYGLWRVPWPKPAKVIVFVGTLPLILCSAFYAITAFLGAMFTFTS